MESLDDVRNKMIKMGKCKATYTLAHAAASACSQKYGVSFLRVCVGLDLSNKKLVLGLFDIANQVDFSNRDQDEMLYWLDNNGYLSNIPTAEQL